LGRKQVLRKGGRSQRLKGSQLLSLSRSSVGANQGEKKAAVGFSGALREEEGKSGSVSRKVPSFWGWVEGLAWELSSHRAAKKKKIKNTVGGHSCRGGELSRTVETVVNN